MTRPTRSVASLEEIREWGATIDLATASVRAFGISKSYGHELANRGKYLPRAAGRPAVACPDERNPRRPRRRSER